jgi:ribonuclease HI
MNLYTDGSCDLVKGVGGWAVIDEDTMTVLKRGAAVGGTVTNNRMELQAVIEAVLFCKDNINEIYTDSQYVSNGINKWLPTWVKNNFRTASKQPVKNQDLWIKLKTILSEKLGEGISIEINWVRAHNGHPANSLADATCYDAMLHAKELVSCAPK